MQWFWMVLWMQVSLAEQPPSVGELHEINEVGVALEEAPLLDPPSAGEVESRTYALGKILRCPVCQGLSVADSQSDAAVAMKNRIQELVAMGYSDDQIIDYFIGRYGEFVLLQPKAEHWFVWWMPLLLLGAGAGVVVLRVLGSKDEVDAVNELGSSVTVSSQQDGETAESVSTVNANTDKYRAQLLAELED